MNYVGGPVQLSLELEAFPLPHTFLLLFRGPGRNLSEAVTGGKVHVDCWNTLAAYAVTCNLTVDGIGPADAGFYFVQIENDVGPETVEFEITYYGKIVCSCDVPCMLSSLFRHLCTRGGGGGGGGG